jgi:hypothetical protein
MEQVYLRRHYVKLSCILYAFSLLSEKRNFRHPRAHMLTPMLTLVLVFLLWHAVL